MKLFMMKRESESSMHSPGLPFFFGFFLFEDLHVCVLKDGLHQIAANPSIDAQSCNSAVKYYPSRALGMHAHRLISLHIYSLFLNLQKHVLTHSPGPTCLFVGVHVSFLYLLVYQKQTRERR